MGAFGSRDLRVSACCLVQARRASGAASVQACMASVAARSVDAGCPQTADRAVTRNTTAPIRVARLEERISDYVIMCCSRSAEPGTRPASELLRCLVSGKCARGAIPSGLLARQILPGRAGIYLSRAAPLRKIGAWETAFSSNGFHCIRAHEMRRQHKILSAYSGAPSGVGLLGKEIHTLFDNLHRRSFT